MDEKSAKPEGRNWSKIAWIVFAGFLATFTGTAVFLSGADPTPTVYHRADGTFSLNRPDGPSTTPEDLRDLLKTYEKFGRVRLVCNSQTKFSDWNPYLNAGGAAGAPYYQLEASGNVYSFTLPGCPCIHDHNPVMNPSLLVVNLSGNDENPPLDMAVESDIAVLIDPSTTCEQALAAAEEFKGQNKSISIICDPKPEDTLHLSMQYLNFKPLYSYQPHRVQSMFGGTYLISQHSLSEKQWILRNEQSGELTLLLQHHKEDETANHTFRLKRSKFWKDHIQPVIDQIKAIF